MKIRFLRLIALVLTAAVLLSGCGMVDFGEYFGAVRSLVDGNAIVPYEHDLRAPGHDPAPADAGRRLRGGGRGRCFGHSGRDIRLFTTPMTGSAPTTRWRISITVQI